MALSTSITKGNTLRIRNVWLSYPIFHLSRSLSCHAPFLFFPLPPLTSWPTNKQAYVSVWPSECLLVGRWPHKKDNRIEAGQAQIMTIKVYLFCNLTEI